MKLLVLVQDYPKLDGSVTLMYVHTRNLYYLQKNIDVTVLSFSAIENYIIDNIPVITLEDYKKNSLEKYDLLVCHAPNVKNHYKFLRMFERKFDSILFFYHGHEVIRINAIYPNPYPYQKKTIFLKKTIQDIYDTLKLKIWHDYLPKIAYKSHFVFVSRWMYDEFIKWTKIHPKVLQDRYSIIHNSVGKAFEENDYNPESEMRYDFITVRSFLDGSKYCIDLVHQLAKYNKSMKFLIIGRGEFFNYYDKEENITWIDKTLTHSEIITYMNQSKCALMPTRADAQGLMMCEMATFGIPLITSDISLCRDICAEFENIYLINNENTNLDLVPVLENLLNRKSVTKNKKYFADNTCGTEVDIIKNALL
ncbi:glycosyltransferase [Paenibacillus nitricinens]|uniref:glycosyltransferase n=1 Tax=Paenibacillus nitricinens TaxID=3367691 RepID=UPI003F86C275